MWVFIYSLINIWFGAGDTHILCVCVCVCVRVFVCMGTGIVRSVVFWAISTCERNAKTVFDSREQLQKQVS